MLYFNYQSFYYSYHNKNNNISKDSYFIISIYNSSIIIKINKNSLYFNRIMAILSKTKYK